MPVQANTNRRIHTNRRETWTSVWVFGDGCLSWGHIILSMRPRTWGNPMLPQVTQTSCIGLTTCRLCLPRSPHSLQAGLKKCSPGDFGCQAQGASHYAAKTFMCRKQPIILRNLYDRYNSLRVAGGGRDHIAGRSRNNMADQRVMRFLIFVLTKLGLGWVPPTPIVYLHVPWKWQILYLPDDS